MLVCGISGTKFIWSVYIIGDIGEDRKPITLASLKDKSIVFEEDTITDDVVAEAIAAEAGDFGVEDIEVEDIEVVEEVTPPIKTWGQTIFGSWSGN